MVVRFSEKHHRIAAVILPHTALPDGPSGMLAWQRVIERLYTFSNSVETLTPGTAFVRLHPTLYEQLAESFPNARIGLAATCEQALLAATASLGIVKDPAVLNDVAITHLPAELHADELDRFTWLGVRTIGQLRTWSTTHIESVLGASAPRVLPFIHGPERRHLQSDPKPVQLRVQFDASELLHEPHEWLPVLGRISKRIHQRLAGRGSRMLELRLDAKTYSDITKWELQHLPEITRAFERLALRHDEPFQTITGTVFSVIQPVQQTSLWATERPVDSLLHELALRFPGQFVTCHWIDPRSQAADLAWEWQTQT